MSGVIPESICNTAFTSSWLNYENGMFHNNSFCPPYPSCIEDYMGTQDTSGCE